MTKISQVLIRKNKFDTLQQSSYHTFLTRHLALCCDVVRTCLKLSESVPLPVKIVATASIKPLKIKGTRKLTINLSGSCFDNNAWNYSNAKQTPLIEYGMYNEARDYLIKLFNDNGLSHTEPQTVWVHIKAIDA